MKFALLVILFAISGWGFAQHRGEIILDGLPAHAKITVVTPSGDVPPISYERPLGQTSAKWISSSPCVVVAIKPKGTYNFTLRLADTLTRQGTTNGVIYTCPPSWELPKPDREECLPNVYPNPTSGFIYSDCTLSFQIIDQWGRIVGQLNQSKDLSHFPDGTYFLRRGLFEQKIIKQRF